MICTAGLANRLKGGVGVNGFDLMESTAAWTEDRLINPHADPEKAKRVEAMFSAIAASYDLNNRVHSLGLDRVWRKKAAGAAMVRPGDVVVDVACGTGDLSLAFARGVAGAVVGVDFAYPMLLGGVEKNHRGEAAVRPEYVNGDALRLPLADGCADVVSIAFGIRNVSGPVEALAEFYRVLRPGGRLVILEFGIPGNRLLRGLYRFYFNRVMPRTATLLAGDKSGAYRYLPKSVDTFLDCRQLAQMMTLCGFESIVTRALTAGIAVIYRGVKPRRQLSGAGGAGTVDKT